MPIKMAVAMLCWLPVTLTPDVEAEALLRGRVPDDFGSGAARIKNQTVILVDGRDVTDQSQDGVRVACQMRGPQVDVAGGAPGVIRGQKNTAFEHEVVCPLMRH
jgi:hypothetical protein